jgi:hypothetical protein
MDVLLGLVLYGVSAFPDTSGLHYGFWFPDTSGLRYGFWFPDTSGLRYGFWFPDTSGLRYGFWFPDTSGLRSDSRAVRGQCRLCAALSRAALRCCCWNFWRNC